MATRPRLAWPGRPSRRPSATRWWVSGCRLPPMLSVLGKSAKISLGLLVPSHSRDGVLPPAFHLLRGRLVLVVVTVGHFPEMAVLGFYDLVSGATVVGEVAWAAQLLARHRLHVSLPLG